MYTQEELEKCLKQAWSYENRDRHEAAEQATEYIGTVRKKRRLYDIHTDTTGRFWYRVRILTQQGPKTEYEAIFGHKEPRIYKKPKGERWNENHSGYVAERGNR